MDGFDPWGFFILFFSLLILACRNGEKTTEEDDEINDYLSDG